MLSDPTIVADQACLIRQALRAARAGILTGMDAITDVPMPANEPVHEYAPDSPERTRLVTTLDAAGRRRRSTCRTSSAAHTGWAAASASTSSSRTGTPPARHPHQRHHADATAAVDAAIAAKADMGGDPVRRTGRRLPARRRPAGRAVAGEARRRHDARPVQDRVPGRDRRALRAGRLLAVQRRVRPPDPGPAADQQPGVSGTAPTTGRWRASSTRSRRSTSPPSRATCRPRPR